MCKKYAYIRVSTKEQNEDRQLAAMLAYGVPTENIILDRQSGKDFERSGYKRLVRKLRRGDTLVVKSIDRLGRNYAEILEQWRMLTRKKQVSIVVIDMPLLDTRQSLDLTGVVVADIVLQLLSYVAETERNFIRQRQAEGIAAARERGVNLGRRPKERPREFESLKAEWKSGAISAREAARRLRVDHMTFKRWASETPLEQPA
ncbi:recombinase family protein [Cloacibacillus sp. An23]|uniref:recombinase family protein n=1 Tax=Cloacibacillus sp. An23 TaxID=1965591 RepID=UPI000B36D079|nr:recombinase family protein [Cloacibacillus sp. An23]OUO91894.1 resolvase [Cloacibacillus sp. An23]